MRLSFIWLLTATAVCATSTSVQAQIAQPFNKTIVVQDSGNPVTNGTNLITAISIPAAPGSNDRWIVKLEPGTFDIGNSTLVLRDFVDVEGSGRNSTNIIGRSSQVVLVPSAVEVEMRELTVTSDPNGLTAATAYFGVVIETPEFKLTSVNIEVTSPSNGTGILVSADGRPRLAVVSPRVSCTRTCVGLDVSDSEGVILNEMFVFILSLNSTNIGMRLTSNSGEAVLEGASGFVAGGRTNYGALIEDAQPRIANNNWEVNGLNNSSASTFGILNAGNTTIKDSIIEAGGSGRDTGVITRGGELQLQSVVVQTFAPTTPIFQSSPIGVDVAAGRAELNQCVVKSRIAVRSSGNTNLFVGATQLSGARSVAGSSRCAQSYDGAFTDIPNGPC